MERFFSDRFSGLLNNLIFRRKGIESYKLKKKTSGRFELQDLYFSFDALL